uniref:Uncharacterized protein n=1 Tax=Ditylenchus dipsaci TaxID=166011 RepID=A0A915CS27_9BILA
MDQPTLPTQMRYRTNDRSISRGRMQTEAGTKSPSSQLLDRGPSQSGQTPSPQKQFLDQSTEVDLKKKRPAKNRLQRTSLESHSCVLSRNRMVLVIGVPNKISVSCPTLGPVPILFKSPQKSLIKLYYNNVM